MRRRLRPGGLVPAFRTACYEASSPKTARAQKNVITKLVPKFVVTLDKFWEVLSVPGCRLIFFSQHRPDCRTARAILHSSDDGLPGYS